MSLKSVRARLRDIIGIGVAVTGVAAAVITAGAQAADTQELRIGTTDMPPSLGNPFRNTGTPHVFTWSATFDGLTRIDRDGNVQPWLALSWENLGPLRWRIKLRPGVTFSNGAPFTAGAVKTVVDYLRGPDAVREAMAREFAFLAGAEVVDNLTVDLLTREPVPTLPRTLPLLYMVDPETWTRLGPDAFAREPVATGPYRVERMDENGWTLSAFAQSWRAPQIPRMRWIAAPDSATRVQAILADQLDIALALGPDEIAEIEAAGGTGSHWRTAVVWSIQFHQYGRDTPLNDVRVREALNLAVDRQALIDGLLAGSTVPATQPATRGTYGFDPSIPPIPFDRARAKALLTDAGYPDGFKFVVQGVVGSAPSDGAMYQKVAQDLAAVGVTMEIRQFPVAELIRSVMEGNWNGDAFGMTFANEQSVDALRSMQNHSCLWPHPWYCNQAVMPLIAAAKVEFDPERALALRHEVMRFYRNDWSALYLYDMPRFAGLRAGVEGFEEVHGFVSVDRITKKD
ncbi:MAG: hypothetical protein KDE14_14165 [Rhodobacteraceae bacterium]|nr:hypothetical protein [Paracoccaceae bacterium]